MEGVSSHSARYRMLKNIKCTVPASKHAVSCVLAIPRPALFGMGDSNDKKLLTGVHDLEIMAKIDKGQQFNVRRRNQIRPICELTPNSEDLQLSTNTCPVSNFACIMGIFGFAGRSMSGYLQFQS
jgi:hypothetical protein